MKRTLRRMAARLAPAAPHAGLRVLLYHAIAEPDPADRMGLRVTPHDFRAHMSLLRDLGCAVVPLSSLLDAAPVFASPRVAITFDDGYRSQAAAADVLREFGYPATFFLTPRFLDGRTRPSPYWETWGHLTWDEAPTALGDFDLGAHSATHPDLTHCSDDMLVGELHGARMQLEQKLGRAVVTASYPFGRHDARVRAAARRAGYRLVCTSRYGVNRSIGPAFDVRRIEVSGRDTLADVRAKVVGQYDWFGLWQDLRAPA
jgi:peptidoglycan/xylan/chitin deacetylase (PgdA/CDA1 family)